MESTNRPSFSVLFYSSLHLRFMSPNVEINHSGTNVPAKQENEWLLYCLCADWGTMIKYASEFCVKYPVNCNWQNSLELIGCFFFILKRKQAKKKIKSHFLQSPHLLCGVSTVCVRQLSAATAPIAQQPPNKFPLGGEGKSIRAFCLF